MENKTPTNNENEKLLEALSGIKIISHEYVSQLETELADKDRQLAEARAEIEQLKQELRDNSALAARQIVPTEMALDDATAELVRKDRLIEQMRALIESEICKPCTTMRCDICKFQAALSAAERR